LAKGKLFYQIKTTYGFPDELINLILRARRLAREYKSIAPAGMTAFQRKLEDLAEEHEDMELTVAWGTIVLRIHGQDRSNLLY